MQTIGKSKITTLVVNQTVLAEAIRAANGDPARLEIIDANTITVWNSRQQRDNVIRYRKGHKMAVNSAYGKAPMYRKPQLRSDGEWPA